ncbi:MAG TPA: acetylglutamate kinase [Alphaproteobacteria bacterium]
MTDAQNSTVPVINASDLLEKFLDYQKEYNGKVVGAKFGAEIADDEKAVREIARQASIMCRTHMGPLLFFVHGGGLVIDKALKDASITPEKDLKTGLRITDPKTMEICDRELRALNGRLVRIFNSVNQDVWAHGMAGYDGGLLSGIPLDPENNNFTGNITKVNTKLLSKLMNRRSGINIPMIYSICHSSEAGAAGYRINVNADNAAAAVADAMQARRMLFLTNSHVRDKNGDPISKINVNDVERLIADGTITDGMIPKVRAARDLTLKLPADGGVVILDGKKAHCMLDELYGTGGGSLVTRDKAPTLSM